MRSVLTPEDRNEGWFDHGGGDCPVDGRVFIHRILYRSGDIAIADMRAWCLDWKHDRWFPMVDIVAYQPER